MEATWGALQIIEHLKSQHPMKLCPPPCGHGLCTQQLDHILSGAGWRIQLYSNRNKWRPKRWVKFQLFDRQWGGSGILSICSDFSSGLSSDHCDVRSCFMYLLRFLATRFHGFHLVSAFFGVLAHAVSKCDLSSKRMTPAEGFKQPLADGATVLHAGW